MEKLPLLIALEGPDCSGKTTILKDLKELYPQVNFVDRDIVSHMVYNRKFKRTTFWWVPVDVFESYWLHYHKYNERFINILFTADSKTLAKRAFRKCESFCENTTFEEVQRMLEIDDYNFYQMTEKLYKEWGFNYIVINTDEPRETNLERLRKFIDGQLSV